MRAEGGGQTGDFTGLDGEKHLLRGDVGLVRDEDFVNLTVGDARRGHGTVKSDGREARRRMRRVWGFTASVNRDVTLTWFVICCGEHGVELERNRIGDATVSQSGTIEPDVCRSRRRSAIVANDKRKAVAARSRTLFIELGV